MDELFLLGRGHTVHCWKRDSLSFPTMYRTPAADVILPSFCQITCLHGTIHSYGGVVMTACMTGVTGLTNHSEWLKIGSFLQTPRAPGQLSTCGFWLQVDETGPHQEAKPVWRNHFTGAGRCSATERTHNSMQTYSTWILPFLG